MKKSIHPTALVAKGARIAPGVQVGPYCVIGDKVSIGRNTRLHSHVTIDGKTSIGASCEIYPYAAIGFPPQDIKYKGEDTEVIIGDRNIFREYVTVHRGSLGGDGKTEIGDDNFLMAYCHVAHDVKIANRVIMANAIQLAGHCEVQSNAVIGGVVAVHQFCRIGTYAMVAGFSGVPKDVPPFMISSGGERAKLYGPNLVGLKRGGFSDEKIASIKKAYRMIFQSKLSLREAVEEAKNQIKDSPEVDTLIEFIEQKSKRGIIR